MRVRSKNGEEMTNVIKRAVIILIILPLYLSGGELSIRVGANHSWLYYSEDLMYLENEFNPGLSIGLNASAFSRGNFESSYGIRFFSVGRYDELRIGGLDVEVELKHFYLSLPLQLDYALIVRLKAFLNVEPAFQIMSRFKHEINGSPEDEKSTITDEMNRFNLFLGIGLKYRFAVGGHELGVGAQINYGLFRISKDEQFDVTEQGSRSWLDWRAREIVLNVEYIIRV